MTTVLSNLITISSIIIFKTFTVWLERIRIPRGVLKKGVRVRVRVRE